MRGSRGAKRGGRRRQSAGRCCSCSVVVALGLGLLCLCCRSGAVAVRDDASPAQLVDGAFVRAELESASSCCSSVSGRLADVDQSDDAGLHAVGEKLRQRGMPLQAHDSAVYALPQRARRVAMLRMVRGPQDDGLVAQRQSQQGRGRRGGGSRGGGGGGRSDGCRRRLELHGVDEASQRCASPARLSCLLLPLHDLPVHARAEQGRRQRRRRQQVEHRPLMAGGEEADVRLAGCGAQQLQTADVAGQSREVQGRRQRVRPGQRDPHALLLLRVAAAVTASRCVAARSIGRAKLAHLHAVKTAAVVCSPHAHRLVFGC